MRTLRMKALIATVVIFLLLGGAGAYVYLEFRRSYESSSETLRDIRTTQQDFEHIPQYHTPLWQITSRLLSTAQEFRHEMILFALGETQESDRLARVMKRLKQQKVELLRLWQDDIDKSSVERLKGSIGVVEEIHMELLEIKSPIQRAEMIDDVRTEMDILNKEAGEVFEVVQEAMQLEIDRANRRISGNVKNIARTLLETRTKHEQAMLAFLAVCVLSLAIMILFGRRLRKRFQTLATSMRKIGNAESIQPLPVTDPPDELDALSQDINNMLERLWRATAGMRESEEKFRMMTLHSQDGIIMMDNAGKISYWNKGAERISLCANVTETPTSL